MTKELRADIRKSTICVWETILCYRKNYKDIQDWQCYTAHKQSLSFAKGLFSDKNAKIEKYNKNNRIFRNCKKAWELTKD